MTGDWRTPEHPGQATLLERLAYGRALAERVSNDRLLDFALMANGERPAAPTAPVDSARDLPRVGDILEREGMRVRVIDLTGTEQIELETLKALG